MKKCATVWLLLLTLFSAQAQQFKVSYTPAAYTGPFTGNVLLYLSKKHEQPKNQPGWPCYRLAVRNVKPGDTIVFSDAALSYPTLLSRIDRGEYYVQAVWDLAQEGRVIGLSTGNPYSQARKVTLQATSETFTLVCDQVVPAPVFVETKFCKEFKAPSALLSRFHGKPSSLDAAVILPADYYRHPQRRYPVLFTVGGFGGDYHHYSRSVSRTPCPLRPLIPLPAFGCTWTAPVCWGTACTPTAPTTGPLATPLPRSFCRCSTAATAPMAGGCCAGTAAAATPWCTC